MPPSRAVSCRSDYIVASHAVFRPSHVVAKAGKGRIHNAEFARGILTWPLRVQSEP